MYPLIDTGLAPYMETHWLDEIGGRIHEESSSVKWGKCNKLKFSPGILSA